MSDNALVTWNTAADLKKVLADSYSVDECDGVIRSIGSNNRTFINVDQNLSIKSEYNVADYYSRRGGEDLRKTVKGKIQLAMDAYKNVGIVKNIIDLMGDFACQGVGLVHPNDKIEKFYQRWFEKVDGKDRSERFLNYLYRSANIIVRRIEGKLPNKTEKEWKKLHGVDKIEEIKVPKRIIPVRYIFHNPLAVELLGDNLAGFIGERKFALKISRTLHTNITRVLDSSRVQSSISPNTELIDGLSQQTREGLKRGSRLLPLDPDNTMSFYYKKDDWELWADPMIGSILSDLQVLTKLKLADMSALDGAISSIRLWTLGDLDNKILPTRAAINKLRNILSNNVAGGTMDLVWGPELKFQESEAQIHNFLGPDKYIPHLNAIYDGLGVPSSLTASAGSSSPGFSNNFISLKTLVERLEYGRDILRGFWRNEIKRVQLAMGFRFPAQLVFDQMILSDEAAEKALLIQLADRDIISYKTLHERFDILPEIENLRINKERRKRGDKMPDKAGPYHKPQIKDEFKKIILQGGGVAPSELGIELLPRKEGEESHLEKINKLQKDAEKFKPTGNPNDGRPRNSKDKSKRKQKRVIPRTAANNFTNMFLWANEAQQCISDKVSPALLHVYKKDNLRQLTRVQLAEAEYIKFSILCGLEPFEEISDKMVYNLLKSSQVSKDILAMSKTLAFSFITQNNRQPTLDEQRQIQALAYTLDQIGEEDE